MSMGKEGDLPAVTAFTVAPNGARRSELTEKNGRADQEDRKGAAADPEAGVKGQGSAVTAPGQRTT